MITEETVFVLGAGASAPYGYPTGFELRQKICLDLIMDFHKKGMDIDDFFFKDFMKDFAFSNIHSIDKFLSNNPGYEKAGKAAIAFYILKSELDSKYPHHIKKQNENWFGNLYNKMTDEMFGGNSLEEFKRNKVSFITFNYDRSLEEFFFYSLKSSFSKLPSTKVANILKKFPFLHVYGKIADLPWQNTMEYLLYKTDFNKIQSIYNCSKKIKVIYDDRKTDANIVKLREILRDTKRIFFLGFGYAKENMEILGIPDIFLDRKKLIYGTAKGYTNIEIDNVKSYFRNNNNEKLLNVYIEDCDSNMLLRNYL